MKSKNSVGFADRLRQAFGGASNADIARKLGLSGQSVVTKWMAGVFPTADQLLRIWQITKTNLHWLLTGEGEADLDPLRFLDERTRKAVTAVASSLKQSPEDVLADLTTEALTRRAAEMIANLRQLDGAQVDQLYAILSLIDLPDAGDVGVRSPRVSKG